MHGILLPGLGACKVVNGLGGGQRGQAGWSCQLPGMTILGGGSRRAEQQQEGGRDQHKSSLSVQDLRPPSY